MGKGKPPHSLRLYIEGDMVSYTLNAGNVDSPLPQSHFPIRNAKGIPFIFLGFGRS